MFSSWLLTNPEGMFYIVSILNGSSLNLQWVDDVGKREKESFFGST